MAFKDICHLLHPAHLAQLQKILDDLEASSNDHFMAMELLRNDNIESTRIVTGCQDTGTAIIMEKRGHLVLTDGNDKEYLSGGAYNAYTWSNLHYIRWSQFPCLRRRIQALIYLCRWRSRGASAIFFSLQKVEVQ
eukprot:CCRYP_011668-RA/>CCRYP_011668-RA protein AED:0.48 eAED:0.48 QI:0/-1/0/1/-1/1/1/0/134